MSSRFSLVPSSNDVAGAPPYSINSHNVYSGVTPSAVVTSSNGKTHNTSMTNLQHAYLHRTQKSDSMLSLVNSDLERLERLKREILEGQNPYYQPSPRPDFLEHLYLGRRSHPNTVPDYSEKSTSNNQPRSDLLIEAGTSFSQPKEKVVGDIVEDQHEKRLDAPLTTQGLTHDHNPNNLVTNIKSEFNEGREAPSAVVHTSVATQSLSQVAKPEVTIRNVQSSDINARQIVTDGGQLQQNAKQTTRMRGIPSHAPSADNKTFSISDTPRGYGTDDKSMHRPAILYPNSRHASGHTGLSGVGLFDSDKEQYKESAYQQNRHKEQDREKRLQNHNEVRGFEGNLRASEKKPISHEQSARQLLFHSTELSTGGSESSGSARKETTLRPALEDRISHPLAQNDRTDLHVITDEYLIRGPGIKGHTAQSNANANGGSLSSSDKAALESHSTETTIPLEARLSLTSPIKEEQPTDRFNHSLEERIGSRVSMAEENKNDSQNANVSENITGSMPSLQDRITTRPTLEERIGVKPFQAPIDGHLQTASDYSPNRTVQGQMKRITNNDKDSSIRSTDDRPRPHDIQAVSRRESTVRPAYDFDSRQISSIPLAKSRVQYESVRSISPHRQNSVGVPPRDDYRERVDFRHGMNVYGRETGRHYSEDRRVDIDSRDLTSRSTPLHDLGQSQGRPHDHFLRDVNDRHGPPVLDTRGRPTNMDSRGYRNSWDRDDSTSRADYTNRFSRREVWGVEIPGERRSSLPAPSSWDRNESPPRSRPSDFSREDFHHREFERNRYPPDSQSPNARIRPRSPSPLHGAIHAEDIRPFKRTRESVYFTAPRDGSIPRDAYYDRRPPSPRDLGGYFEPHDFSYSSRDILPHIRDRPIDPAYDRRVLDIHPPRSPPFQARTLYSRTDSRIDPHFSVPSRPGT